MVSGAICFVPVTRAGAKSELIDYRHPQCFHHRSRVLSEALLARDERIPMVRVFQLALLQIFCKSHIMMRPQQKASSLSFQPLPHRLDFRRGCSCSDNR